jgi:hypothetical protein
MHWSPVWTALAVAGVIGVLFGLVYWLQFRIPPEDRDSDKDQWFGKSPWW